jgi:glutathione peroxidase
MSRLGDDGVITSKEDPVAVLRDFKATMLDGDEKSLSDYDGDVVLIVNTASKCGFTPQYAGLEELHRTLHERGLTVLGFPCNQFGAQEPGTEEEIGEFCQKNYGVTFPMFAKIDVNGDGEHPLYTWLKSEKGGLMGRNIKWNFTKFLVGRDGAVIARYAPNTEPAALVADIEKALAVQI